MQFFDINGHPMASEDWVSEYAGVNDQNRIITEEHLWNGFWVSTVFLCRNCALFSQRIPDLFETMVFLSRNSMKELYCSRYFTKAEAIEGHKRVVAEFSTIGKTISTYWHLLRGKI